MSFFSSLEFYIIMAVVAAAVIALAAKPQTRGAVVQHLVGSRLVCPDDQQFNDDLSKQPAVEFRCLSDGCVILYRTGLEGISDNGAVSAAIDTDGININIEERLVPGRPTGRDAAYAVFNLDFLRPGRYHVRYNSSQSGLFVAFSLHVREGIVATRMLKN